MQINNLGKMQTIKLEKTSHIIQANKTTRQNEIYMSTGKGLLFANIVDFGEWQVTIKDEAYFKE